MSSTAKKDYHCEGVVITAPSLNAKNESNIVDFEQLDFSDSKSGNVSPKHFRNNNTIISLKQHFSQIL